MYKFSLEYPDTATRITCECTTERLDCVMYAFISLLKAASFSDDQIDNLLEQTNSVDSVYDNVFKVGNNG